MLSFFGPNLRLETGAERRGSAFSLSL